MIRFLIARPIGVLLTFSLLLMIGFFSLLQLPISLLPNIDVPKIKIDVPVQNASADFLEHNLVRIIRGELVTLNHVKSIESLSQNHSATIYLDYELGIDMDLAYIEASEKIDHILNSLPRDTPRPIVSRVNASDIPIAKIQITPENADQYFSTSELTVQVLKRRIEQLPGVSVVDVAGRVGRVIEISPNLLKLRAVNLNVASIEESITASNYDFGSISVKDGQYRFFVKLENTLTELQDLRLLPITLKDGTVIKLEDIASIDYRIEQPSGIHLFNKNQSIVLAVHKSDNSRMNEIVPQLESIVEEFRTEYQGIEFSLSQNQSFLLTAAIQNLSQDLVFGGGICVMLLFIFVGNFRSPLLMAISIPSSLLLTFILFSAFQISLNIISLSGLALGIGMLIDNSIVVIDSITRKRQSGQSLEDSANNGVRDVILPVISQVLTTVAVYAPLIYVSGLTGELVRDQAIALTISLGVSLFVAFLINPVLYTVLMKNVDYGSSDTRIFKSVLHWYNKLLGYVFRRKIIFLFIGFLIMPIGFFLIKRSTLTYLPNIESSESFVKIDWNEPISLTENINRTQKLLLIKEELIVESEAEVGIKQYLIQTYVTGYSDTEIYIRCETQKDRKVVEREMDRFVKQYYPHASCEITQAPNAFTQLFVEPEPYYEARFYYSGQLDSEKLKSSLTHLSTAWITGEAFTKEQSILLKINLDQAAKYRFEYGSVIDQLERTVTSKKIGYLSKVSQTESIHLAITSNDLNQLMNTGITNRDGESYPLSSIATANFAEKKKSITADERGTYYSIEFENIENIDFLEKALKNLAQQQGLLVHFSGSYFRAKIVQRDIVIVFLICIVLLYFILALQFENLIDPVIVMLTIPLGITGAMTLLFLNSGSIDLMAAIGFVVVLGIIVDDPILKIDMIKKLQQNYLATHGKIDLQALEKCIKQAGEICLKPLLLTSLTTSLALLPLLLTSGIGTDLQKPLIWVIVGGLSIGTFSALWFVPLVYWFVTKIRLKL